MLCSVTSMHALNKYKSSSVPVDPQVHLLLHGDSLSDSSSYQRPVTGTGATGVTPSSSVTKVGPSSLYFPGDSLLTYRGSPSVALGTGDFTFECWFMLTATPTVTYILNSDISLWVRYYSNSIFNCSGGIEFYPTLNTNQWYHVAYGRVSGLLYIYIDGVLKKTKTYTTAFAVNTSLIVGGSSSLKMSGYVDEARLVVGRSVYDGASNFTPSTTPFS